MDSPISPFHKTHIYNKIICPQWWHRRLSRLSDRHSLKRELEILKLSHKDHSIDLSPQRNKKILKILNYAQKHCPYYRDIFSKKGITTIIPEDLTAIPLLDKSIIRSNISELLSDEINFLDYYLFSTGGSTGEPFQFPLTANTDGLHQRFLYEMIGYAHGDVIVAFDGSPVDDERLSKDIYWTEANRNDIPYGRLSYSSLYLSERTMPFYVENLLKIKPSILRGYPSFLNSIAEYLIENKIVLNFSIKGVELTAENPFDYQINNIREAFKSEVYFQYGHSEACVFGYTLDNSYEYFCSPFYGHTEVLNQDGSHVGIGETGEVVVTGFYNYIMPFIRYRTGDQAVYSGESQGIVRLKSIVGRTQDYVYQKNHEKVSLTALVFGLHYKAFGNIQKWQIQQDCPGKVTFRIVKRDAFSESDSAEILGNFKNVGGIDASIEFVQDLPQTQRGKSRFLIQNIDFHSNPN